MYNIEKNSKFVIDLPLQNNNPSEWSFESLPRFQNLSNEFS